MNKKIIFLLILTSALWSQVAQSQDTFSIVAVDPVTGEVGSAGASCVDLFQSPFSNDDFISQLVPGVGAINSQAYYIPANQENATARMNAGDTPEQIIQWLINNDVSSEPDYRQYGIAALINGVPATAGHTGASTDDYKGHIVGSNYAIQGNILLGQAVLDSMQARFLNETGDLACKLMAALQGANMVGADSRCSTNGTSSLFAFVSVAQPNDIFGSPSFRVSVRTADNAGIEPIDSLQSKFDLVHNCNAVGIAETPQFDHSFSLYPNPSKHQLTVTNQNNKTYKLYLISNTGEEVYTDTLNKKKNIDVSKFSKGIYFLKIMNGKDIFVKKIVID
jgi:uncharacterized Ntn-hydrolase superfamily protein